MRTLIGLLLTLLFTLSLLPVGLAQADDTCFRVTVYFNADERTELTGKLVVRYSDGSTTRFRDFYLDREDEDAIEAGATEELGFFTVTDLEDVEASANDDAVDIDGNGDFDVEVKDCSDAGRFIDDGRLNPNRNGSITIVYELGEGGLQIYQVNPATGDGTRIIRATTDEVNAALAAATAPDGANTLIARVGFTSLWALMSDECQINTFFADGKPDVFTVPCGSPTDGE